MAILVYVSALYEGHTTNKFPNDTFFWNIFLSLSDWIFISNLFKAELLETNPFGFPSLENIYISLLFLNDFSLDTEFLAGNFIFLIIEDLFHCFLTSRASMTNPAIWVTVSFYALCHFTMPAVKIFSFPSLFSRLIVCEVMIFFWFILLGFWAFQIYKCMFLTKMRCSQTSSNVFCATVLLSFRNSSDINLRPCDVTWIVPKALLISLQLFFFVLLGILSNKLFS